MQTQKDEPNPGKEKYLRLTNLKHVRQLQGLSTKELGERAGIDQSMISKLENERQGAQGRTVRKLAEALGVTPADLAG